jgi:hypothetical protein
MKKKPLINHFWAYFKEKIDINSVEKTLNYNDGDKTRNKT